MDIGAPLFFVARGPCGPQRSCLGREVRLHPLELNPFKTVRSG